MDNSNKKVVEFTAKLHDQIVNIFDDECENQITPEELEEYATEFMHALMTTAPAIVYSKLTNNDVATYLEVNHLANRLCFQFSNLKDEQK